MYFSVRQMGAATFVVSLLASIVVISPAEAQDDGNVFSEEFLAELPVTVDELREIEPNHSWDGLGLFSDDALRVLEVIAEDVVTEPYAFGDDPDGEAVIDPPGADPIRRGAMEWTLPADWAPPAQGVTDTAAFGSIEGLSGGRNVILMWAQYDGMFDFTSGLTINEGFPIAVPGLPLWNSSFAGDTWEGANLIPNAEVEGATVNLVINRFDPPQTFTPVDMPAFYFRSGDIMAMAIDSEALFDFMDAAATTGTAAVGPGETSTLLYTGGDSPHLVQSDNRRLVYGLAGHIARALFTPGRVNRLEAREFALLSHVASTLLKLGIPLPDDIPLGEPLIEDDSAFPGAEADIEEELSAGADTDSAATAGDAEDSDPADDGSGGGSGRLVGGAALISVLVALVIWARVRQRTETSDRIKANKEASKRAVKKRARKRVAKRGAVKKAAVKKAAVRRDPPPQYPGHHD